MNPNLNWQPAFSMWARARHISPAAEAGYRAGFYAGHLEIARGEGVVASEDSADSGPMSMTRYKDWSCLGLQRQGDGIRDAFLAGFSEARAFCVKFHAEYQKIRLLRSQFEKEVDDAHLARNDFGAYKNHDTQHLWVMRMADANLVLPISLADHIALARGFDAA